MRKIFLLLSLFVFIGCSSLIVSAQISDVGIKPNLALGEVTSVSENKIVLQTKDGAIEVVLSGATGYKRIPADNPSLKAATASTLAEIKVGDKLLVTGLVAEDKKSVPAKSIFLISRADIVERQTKEQEEWKTRGISGRVTAVNAQTNEITVSSRGIAGAEKNTVVKIKDTASFRRYAPDSVQFSEAKASTFAEIKPGDMIRALGDKGADETTFTAERVVTGAFKTVGGTIKAIDAAKNEIVVTDIQTKKDVIVAVGKNSTLKQFPAEMAQRMAQFQAMQAGGIQPGGQGGGARPPRANQENGGQPNQGGQAPGGMRPGGGGGMRGGTIDDMLERFPNITIADLKVGEMIAVSSTRTNDAQRITAIKLLSGVEPFLKIPQQAPGQGGGNRRNQDSGFSIPGLESFGTP